jgi:Outer membrane protein beta-barrel domain
MRKMVLPLLVTLLSYISISNAQLIKSYGLKLASTSASQNLEYSTPPWGWWSGSKTTPKPGFNIALFAEWFNVPFFSVVSQIEYAQRGAHLEYAVPGGRWSTDGRVDYLSVPLLAKVTVPMGPASPYLLAGPRADFLVGYQDVEIQPNTNPLYSNFKKAILGGSIGLGVETGSLLPVALLAELRYNVDFFDSYNKDNLKVRNNAIDVWLGVAL